MSDDAGSEQPSAASGNPGSPGDRGERGSEATDHGHEDDASPEPAADDPAAGESSGPAADDPGAEESAGPADGDDEPGFPEDETVSDGREKHVTILLPDGETEEHGGVYLQHTAGTFAVSEDPEFPESETTRYEKADVARVTVKQHHSACFITTAVAGERRTLDDLRGFRDDALAPTAPGGALVALYERISPPIARSLARHPSATPTRAVRGLVRLCARLARRHRTASGPRRPALALALVALYVVGMALGAASHAYFAVTDRRDDGPAAR
ncbi:MAG: CFI-box-CTERM domain-containing protein [Haloferacaceae archaeon]